MALDDEIDLFVGDYGDPPVVLRFPGSDLTGATVTVRYRKPDGTEGFWTPQVVDITAQEARYTLAAPDIDQAGAWVLRGLALWSGPARQRRSRRVVLRVGPASP